MSESPAIQTSPAISWQDRIKNGAQIFGGKETAKQMAGVGGLSAISYLGAQLAESFEGQPGAQRLVNLVFSGVPMFRTLSDFKESLENRDLPDAVMLGITSVIGMLGGVLNEREYVQAFAVLHAIFGFAGALEDGVENNNEEAIEAIRAAIPETATVRRPNGEGGYTYDVVPTTDVKVGDEVVIRPGGYFPVDGTLIDIYQRTGAGADDARRSLSKGTIEFGTDSNGQTGVQEVQINKPLPQGTVGYGDTEFVIRADRISAESSKNRALDLVTQGDNGKSTDTRIEKVLDNVYIPVMLAACGAQFLWAFVTDRRKHGRHKAEVERGERAEEKPHGILHSVRKAAEKTASLALRMAPCAIEAAKMLVPFTSKRLQADHGITVIHKSALETVKDTELLMIDMNGTITTGEWEVEERHSTLPANSDAEREAFRKIAVLNNAVQHTSAEGIARAGRTEFGELDALETLRREAGKPEPALTEGACIAHPNLAGNTAIIGGARVMTGSPAFFEAEGYTIPDALARQAQEAEATGKRVGFGMVQEPGQEPQFTMFVCKDPIRPGAKDAINLLRRNGVKVVLVTGSSRAAADHMAAHLNELAPGEEPLPEESLVIKADLAKDVANNTGQLSKVEVADEYIAQYGSKVAMIGDGINDQFIFKKVVDAGGVAAAVASTAHGITKEEASLLIQGVHQWPGLMSLSKDVSHTLANNTTGVLSWISFLVVSNFLGYDHDKKNNITMDGHLHEWATVAVAAKNVFDSDRASKHIENPRLGAPENSWNTLGKGSTKVLDTLLGVADRVPRLAPWMSAGEEEPQPALAAR